MTKPPYPIFDHHRAREEFLKAPGKHLSQDPVWAPKMTKRGFVQHYKTPRIEIHTPIPNAVYTLECRASVVHQEARFGEINFVVMGGPRDEVAKRLLSYDLAPPGDPLAHPVKDENGEVLRLIVGHHQHAWDRFLGENPAEPVAFNAQLLNDPLQGWLDALNQAFMEWGIMALTPANWDASAVQAAWNLPLPHPSISAREGL